MSAIPPNWIGSVIGSAAASGRAADAKGKESADQAKAVDNSAFAERLQNVIEDTDTDTEVHPDAEGLGSQGRPFRQKDGAGTDEDGGAVPDEGDGVGGLDVEA
jgi:hypothetical protein